MSSEVEARVLKHARNLAIGGKFYPRGEIPLKKLDAAIRAYAPDVVPERVIGLCDTTFFGGADEGFLLTDAAIYFKEFCFATGDVRFAEVTGVDRTSTGRSSRGHLIRRGDGESLLLQTMVLDGNDPVGDALTALIREVIAMREEGLLALEDRYVIVQDMPEEFRVDYAKAAVLLTLADDDQIDATELAEVQLLMTRLELSPAARRQVWRFVTASQEALTTILDRMESTAPKGSWEVLSLSLLKDMLFIARRRGRGEAASGDRFIVALSERLGIDAAQRAFIEQAIAFDEAVLSKSVNPSQLKKMGSDLAAKSAAVGVPLVAIYLSGSVIGLSAAGITSGLAALGLGGLFGLSAMVTGVGVVVVGGVVIYKIIRWATGGEERELAALRERLTQEVVLQLQRTVNALLGDLQELTSDVVSLTREVEIDRARLLRLAQEVSALTGALTTLSTRRDADGERGALAAS